MAMKVIKSKLVIDYGEENKEYNTTFTSVAISTNPNKCYDLVRAIRMIQDLDIETADYYLISESEITQ